jgi:hypothetical protein
MHEILYTFLEWNMSEIQCVYVHTWECTVVLGSGLLVTITTLYLYKMEYYTTTLRLNCYSWELLNLNAQKEILLGTVLTSQGSISFCLTFYPLCDSVTNISVMPINWRIFVKSGMSNLSLKRSLYFVTLWNGNRSDIRGTVIVQFNAGSSSFQCAFNLENVCILLVYSFKMFKITLRTRVSFLFNESLEIFVRSWYGKIYRFVCPIKLMLSCFFTLVSLSLQNSEKLHRFEFYVTIYCT